MSSTVKPCLFKSTVGATIMTNFVKQSSSRHSHPVGREISCVLQNPQVHCHAYNSL